MGIGYWQLVMDNGYWLWVYMGMVIDYMDRVRLGVLGFEVRMSFMLV
jgi:hypothetical protein